MLDYIGDGPQADLNFDDVDLKTLVNKKNLSLKEQNVMNTNRGRITYHLDLFLTYHADPKTNLCMMGEIKELGAWQECLGWMKWTPGDIWVLEKPLITNKFYFKFKFAICENDRKTIRTWERGVDRLCDMEIVEDIPNPNPRSFYDHTSGRNLQIYPPKHYIKLCKMNLLWETYSVSFSVLPPTDDPNWQIFLQGSKVETKDVELHKTQYPIDWMFSKYGKKMQPYTCSVVFPNIEGGVNGAWGENAVKNSYKYKYQMKNRMTGEVINERDPKKTFLILDPSEYIGTLGLQKSSFWPNTDKVMIVNGHCNKADGNFYSDFTFDQIGQTGIYCGTSPVTQRDIQKLAAAGVSGVLDIQSNVEHKQRGIDMEQIDSWYKQCGINEYNHLPVRDDQQSQYADHLFHAVQKLNQIKESGLNVFANDGSGVSRVVTLLIVYFALYIKHEKWNDVEALRLFIKQEYSMYQEPNMQAVNRVINENKSLQRLNYKKWLKENGLEDPDGLGDGEDEGSGGKGTGAVDEYAQFEQEMKILSDDWEKRLQALREKAERIRIQRLTEQEQYLLKMQRVEHQELERIRKLQVEQENIHIKRKSEIVEIETSREHILIQLRQEVELETEKARLKWLEQEQLEAKNRKAKQDEKNLLQKIRDTQDEAKRIQMEAEAIKIAAYDKRGQMAQENEQDKKRIKEVAREAEDYVNKLDQIAGDGVNPGLDANENEDLGLEEDEIAQRVKELFSIAPFKFKPRKKENIDKTLSEHIDDMDIKVPVVWIKDDLYLVGSQKLYLYLDRSCLMIKFKDSKRSFQDYIIKNEAAIERVMAIYTLKSGEELEEILDCLIQDKKIPNVLNQSRIQDKMDKKANNKNLDWKDEPPRFGANQGSGPKSPMRRRNSAIGGGNGPADNQGQHHFCQRCQNYTYTTMAESDFYLNKKHEVVTGLRTVFRNSISKSPSRGSNLNGRGRK